MKTGPTLTITQADDWHIHLREGAFLTRTVLDAQQNFKRVLVMPNLKSPVCTTAQALAYREQILAQVPENKNFEPLMSLYLREDTKPQDLIKAKQSGLIPACKLYPMGATTHAGAGVRNFEAMNSIFESMQDLGLLLLIHAEVTDPEVDIFDREARFIERHLIKIRARFPALKIILEHVTTREGVAFVQENSPNTAATITAHHLLLNRNDLFVGGLRPHHYCLPILKRRADQEALLKAASSGLPCFFLGTDSAPHLQNEKESSCGCAGIYTATYALAYYAHAFEAINALDKLEAFASFYGPDFYGLARNTNKITLTKKTCPIPENLNYGSGKLIPLWAGQNLDWTIH